MKHHSLLAICFFGYVYFMVNIPVHAQDLSQSKISDKQPPHEYSLEALREKYFPKEDKILTLEIIEHYVGEKGIPFPDRLQPMFIIPKQQLELAMMANFGAQADAMLSMLRPTKIEKCKESQTRIKVRKYPGKDLDKVYSDFLFIDEKKLPLNPKEMFGKSTSIQTIRGGPKDPAIHLAHVMKVPCLPYRVRMTGKQRVYLKGFHALRNFDTDPNGAGVYMKGKKDNDTLQ